MPGRLASPPAPPTAPGADRPDAAPVHILLLTSDDAAAREIVDAVRARFGPDSIESVAALADLARVDLARVRAALCALRLADGPGTDALRAILAVRPETPVVMLAEDGGANAALDAVRAGAADFVALVPGNPGAVLLAIEKNLAVAGVRAENRRLQQALNDSLAALQVKNRELEQAVTRLETMALTDELTGLANRRRLVERLEQMYAQAVRYGSDLACLMIDLDGFKAINDTLGHQRGDELLSLAGQVIARSVRAADVAARYGGDEFVVLLPHTSAATAAALAARLSSQFQREAGRMGRVGLRCGMSIGVACLGLSAPSDGDSLLAQADNALYAAKQSGKRRIMVCGPDGVTALDPATLATFSDGEDRPKPGVRFG